jgi:translation initiation factor eIF-2B subunit alpha
MGSSQEQLNLHIDQDINVQMLYKRISDEHPEISAPVAAIKTLLEVIKHSKATTMSEFMETLRIATNLLKNSSEHPISVSAGCDLLTRFVTLTSHDLTVYKFALHYSYTYIYIYIMNDICNC